MIEYALAPVEWHGAINTVHNISTLLALWYAEIHHEADDSEIIACFYDLKKRNVEIYKQLQSMRKFMHVNKTMPTPHFIIKMPDELMTRVIETIKKYSSEHTGKLMYSTSQ